MATYLVFRGGEYEPKGGMADFTSAHTSLDAALAARFDSSLTFVGDWIQVVSVEGDEVKVVDVWTSAKGDDDALRLHEGLKGKVWHAE